MNMMIINIIMMIIITITTIITKIIKEARIPDMEKEAEEEGKETQSLEQE